MLLYDVDKDKNVLMNDDEAERLYQIYIQVQAGDKTALNGLFKRTDNKQICRADEINKEYRMSHMDNVLDSEFLLDYEKNKWEDEWMNSLYSNVTFQFSCLNKMLYKMKKNFLSKAKNTGYENGKRIKNNGYSKFYEGEYEISDLNELMYETIIEIFNEKTDGNNCLTLDGKKNKTPVFDGVSLLKNISYFTSRKINKKAKVSYLDVFDMVYYGEESGEENSCFDKCAFKKFLEADGGISRLTIYEEYLEWFKRNDIHKLFKATACDIKAIIETIMNCDDTFITGIEGDIKTGLGMRFVTQETLQKMIKSRYNINIEQENISKDMEIIEQRLLDCLLYSLNYRIDKAAESTGTYEKESERFLYKLDKKAFIKMFGRASYIIYDKSVNFINNDINSNKMDRYFRIIKKYEDMIIDVVSLEKGKKKYDMVNLILENDDLVDDKKKSLFNIANTAISYYQGREEEYIKNQLKDYKINGLNDRENGYWEAELGKEILKIKLWSSKDIKNPLRYYLNKENLIVYSGYMNLYFCDMVNKICYSVPKNRRIISKSNKNHEILMYNVG